MSPARRAHFVALFGSEGERWLAALPEMIDALSRAWRIELLAPLDTDGLCAWVGLVRREDGGDAVLKLTVPHAEARHEGDALACWGGDGAVRLLAASDDGFALILERAVPGDALSTLPADDADALVCALAPRLWRDPGPSAPFISLSALVAEWRRDLASQLAGYDPAVVDLALALGAELAATSPEPRLLHGDLHSGNVLASGRGWLAIDPKPLVGDPAYEWAQWLGDRCEVVEASADPCGELVRRTLQIAGACALDPLRVAGWTLLKSVAWEFGPARAALFRDVWERVRLGAAAP